MAYFSIVTGNQTTQVIHDLIKIFGLPTIMNDLSFYLENESVRNNSDLLHMQFLNNQCSFRFINKDSAYRTSSSGQIHLKNRNIKYFLKFLQSIDYDKGVLNEIIRLDFYNADKKLTAQCNLNSIHGDLFVFYSLTEEQLKKINRKNKIRILSSEQYSALVLPKNISRGNLFNNLGLINPQINSFTKRFGSDLLLETPCLEVKMNSMSNDYGFYESAFKLLTGNELIELASNTDQGLFKPLSVVIPSFNSNETVVKTLFSIESQNISRKDKAGLDVIIIDDGSKENLFEHISRIFSKLTFRPRVIRMEQNVGLSAARNTGLELAKHDHILFIDSDILLAVNHLLEMSVRLQTIPNAIFISLKQNIEKSHAISEDKCILKGLPSPDTRKDKRVSRQLKKNQVNHHDIDYDIKVEIINDTNYFRDLGFGRIIGGYDLSAMVVGHNMCLRKSLAKEVGGFSNYFQGWGLEDTYFGARIIAAGNYVIPVLSTGVYHIDHLARSGSETKRKMEFKKNIDKYLELIKAPLL